MNIIANEPYATINIKQCDYVLNRSGIAILAALNGKCPIEIGEASSKTQQLANRSTVHTFLWSKRRHGEKEHHLDMHNNKSLQDEAEENIYFGKIIT